MISALRFFAIAPLHSRYMLLALAAVLVSGIVMLVVDPAKGADALAPLALLQMLAASSGFAVAARRGHLDLLLTAGPGRVNVALAHLGLSVLPGIFVWCALGIVEMLVARTVRPSAFASGSVVSVCVVSALAWALTVRLPRLSGGIAWLLGIAMWIVGWSGGPAIINAASEGATGMFTRAVVVTLCPFVLLGKRLSGSEMLLVLPAVTLASALAVSAVTWIVRMDVPLESAQ
jgi:hypothetical protein